MPDNNWPASWAVATIAGTFVDADGTTPLSGVVVFEMTRRSFSASGEPLPPARHAVVLDSTGSFTITVPANDDTDVSRLPFKYRVQENLRNGGGRNGRAAYEIDAPGGTSFNLRTVAPSVGSTTGKIVRATPATQGASAPGSVSPAELASGLAAKAPLVHDHDGTYGLLGDVYNLKPKHFARSRMLLGKVRQGSGNFKISTHGHSIVAGTGATIGAADWPAQLLSRLAGLGYPSAGTGLVGCTRSSSLGTPAESRWAFGAGWGQFAGNNSALASNSTNGNAATFASNVAGTRVDVWYASTGGAFTVSIDGGAAVGVTPPGGSTLSVYSVTGLANTTHTVAISRTSGNALIWGCEVWNNGVGVRMANMGSAGSKAVNTADPNFYAYAKIAANATYGWNSDLATLMIIANDAAAVTSPATFKTQVQTTITNLAPASRDVLLMVDNPTSTIDMTNYIPIMYQLADENDLPLLDMTKRWKSYTLASGLGVMSDVTHPNGLGYADFATAVLRSALNV